MLAIPSAFVLGILVCQQQAHLAPGEALFALTLVAGAACFCLRPQTRAGGVCLFIAFFAAGFSWANWRAEQRLSDHLAASLEGVDLRLTGAIVGLPEAHARGLRFLFEPDPVTQGVPQRLALSWYAQGRGQALPAVSSGQRWQLTVRLRRPHGNLNPNGFDYEGWLFERGVRGVGYVRPVADNTRLGPAPGLAASLNRVRAALRDRLTATLGEREWGGVLVALAIGDQSGITDAQWKLFRDTGVTHLVSISGLHVTMIAALAAWLANTVWRRLPRLCLMLPAQKARLLAGALAAALYVALAGFGVPAQRTLYMLLVAAAAPFLQREAAALRTWTLALLVVLLIDPWAVRSPGFWLSFMAVGALMLAGAAWTRPHWLRTWMQTQWAVLLISLPLLLGLFQQFSLVSPLANALAIPVVSAVVTPLTLLFALLPMPSLLALAHLAFDGLMSVLAGLAALPFAVWQQAAPPPWLVVVATALALYALLPRGVPGRAAALLACLPLITWQPPRPQAGSFRATVLDVGQGLAVHVQTAGKDLLYDTGPRYSPEADGGERVVLPYLGAAGVQRLDLVMLSHDDSDHAGGADSVFDGIPVSRWAGSIPPDNPLRLRPPPFEACRAGQGWVWDGVRFELLHPGDGFTAKKDNEQSCVLKVSARHGSLLLTGDVEREAEAALLAAGSGQLQADVVVAPHHGSRSSSSPPFVAAAAPRYVVFTAGYRNRFGHPHPEVVGRYEQAGARSLRSDVDGAIRFDFRPPGLAVTRIRPERRRYWHR